MLKERQTSEEKENRLTVWKEVKGYEGLYLISDKGEILSLPRIVKSRNRSGEFWRRTKTKFLKAHLRGSNCLYPAVTLTKDGVSKAHSIHRLMATAFIPNPNNLPEVNHKDENTLNYSLDNLEWCDRQYNIEYSKSKRVEQWMDSIKIAEYKSITYASQITGISRNTINNALKGWAKTAGGFVWKYCED
jgi:hypothetical protein